MTMKIYILLVLGFIHLTSPLFANSEPVKKSSLNSPNISANTLLLYQNSNFENGATSESPNGFDLQEAELAFYADVDPYTHLNILLAVHPEFTNSVERHYHIHPEEIFVQSNVIPSFTLKAGKFKALFGRHNELHTHVFPFINAPIVNEKLFGEEGLNDSGLSLAYLAPFPWYFELTLQYLKGKGENPGFQSIKPNEGVGAFHLKNLWDLSEDLTLQWGGSYATGNNALAKNTTYWGIDLTLKFRPSVGGKYHSWILAGEYIQRNYEQPTIDDEKSKGWNVWGKYQFAQRWSVLARYDYFKSENGDISINTQALDEGIIKKYSAALVFAATEFSSYQLEHDVINGPLNASGDSTERRIYVQGNFTIGAHPAHTY